MNSPGEASWGKGGGKRGASGSADLMGGLNCCASQRAVIYPRKKGVLRGSGFAAAPQTPLTPSSLPPQASGGGERHGSNINRDCKSMACTAERLEWKMFWWRAYNSCTIHTLIWRAHRLCWPTRPTTYGWSENRCFLDRHSQDRSTLFWNAARLHGDDGNFTSTIRIRSSSTSNADTCTGASFQEAFIPRLAPLEIMPPNTYNGIWFSRSSKI